jgi:hypothetical protein
LEWAHLQLEDSVPAWTIKLLGHSLAMAGAAKAMSGAKRGTAHTRLFNKQSQTIFPLSWKISRRSNHEA